ncbi:coiled-coil domain-containing protein 186 [Anoplophora glabripennis]|uniref:coiled-coil domain-containing protein 186 n=1 Tax=Anoplophora glabripennis TaxID=217634 RepID=UPI0008758FA5|nr:coiled-coil domain-containing protein 186 [Anoplophora glabripennis]
MSEKLDLNCENETHMLEVNIPEVKTDHNENLEHNKIYKAVVFINQGTDKLVEDENGSNQDLTVDVLESTGRTKVETDFDNKLTETIAYQQKIIEQNTDKIKGFEEKCTYLEQQRKELISQLEQAVKQKDAAIKEKEVMVMRYAVGEKNVLKEKQQRELAEKKYKEATRDNEIFQHKVQTMVSEKARICQMLDNKCYEHKTVQQELERTKADLSALETKLKWSQNSLKSEIEAHKECQGKVESLNSKLQEVQDQIEQAKRDAEDSIKSFQHSQENRAFVLDQQVKEQQASLILLKHEKKDREQQVKALQSDLQRLQTKQKDMLQENNDLSLKVQQLERERLETEQKLSELRGCADQQRQDFADLQAKTVQLEQLKLQLKHEQDQLAACKEQVNLLKQRNSELESDMESCRVREAELLLFTQQLTDKNVRLQSEFTSMETKVQQLTCEQTLLKRQIKEQETKASMLSAKLSEERLKYGEEVESLTRNLEEKTKSFEQCKQEAVDQKGENVLMKRKFEMSLREVNKELQQCRKKLEYFESMENTSRSSSNSSLNGAERSVEPEQVKVIQPDAQIDKQALIEHIVKLQRISAKKSEKLDFLEEHVNTLVAELQRKSKLLQNYILREQAGTLTSNSMDSNKAKLAKLNGVMASMYSSRVVDDSLTLELSLDINRKLQAVLEDALLKNITLKENVDTLGSEIDRLTKLLKS